MLKWGICEEKMRDFCKPAGFEKRKWCFFRINGDLQRENASFSLNWGILEEKTRDFRLNGGFVKRKSVILGLNGGFAKRKHVIFA